MIFLVRYTDLAEFLEDIAPSHLESDWDNSGLQVSPGQENLQEVLIGLDPTQKLIERGIDREVDLLITHHPLIFSELENIDEGTLTGEKLFGLIRNGIGLFSIHTPFDQSRRGLSQGLAEKLDLCSTEPLTKLNPSKLFKLEVFVPREEGNSVIEALTDAGAGKTGDYEDSYYRWKAEGRFKPLESANPREGQKGQPRSTKEIRLDFLVKPGAKHRVISALKRAHPYEEPGFSLEKTERQEPGVGLGRVGEWESKRGIKEVKRFLIDRLELTVGDITVSGNLPDQVTRVAVSPGSGGSAVKPALRSGVDLLITGELDYHERLEVVELGLALIEVGHYHSEKVFSPWMRNLLRNEFSADELEIELHEEGKNR